MPAVESTWFRVDRSQAPYFVALKSPDSKYEYYFAELLMCAHLVTATSSDEVGRGHTPGVCMGRPSQGSASTPHPHAQVIVGHYLEIDPPQEGENDYFDDGSPGITRLKYADRLHYDRCSRPALPSLATCNAHPGPKRTSCVLQGTVRADEDALASSARRGQRTFRGAYLPSPFGGALAAHAP